MSNVSIADIMIHLHPDTSPADRETLEQALRELEGVVSVHFNHADHPHAVVIAYNPDAVSSGSVLGVVRKLDGDAVMAGF